MIPKIPEDAVEGHRATKDLVCWGQRAGKGGVDRLAGPSTERCQVARWGDRRVGKRGCGWVAGPSCGWAQGGGVRMAVNTGGNVAGKKEPLKHVGVGKLPLIR